MEHLGIKVDIKNIPELDKNYIPLHKFNAAFLEGAKKPLGIAVERAGGEVAVVNTFIHGTPDFADADKYYADRMVKTMRWLCGGWKGYISGDESIYEYIRAAYTPEGSRAFDADFMAGVYERPFEVVALSLIHISPARPYPFFPVPKLRPGPPSTCAHLSFSLNSPTFGHSIVPYSIFRVNRLKRF